MAGCGWQISEGSEAIMASHLGVCLYYHDVIAMKEDVCERE